MEPLEASNLEVPTRKPSTLIISGSSLSALHSQFSC